MTTFMAFLCVLIAGILGSVLGGGVVGILAALAVSTACIVHAINSFKNDDPE